jgi:hypothetical protein
LTTILHVCSSTDYFPLVLMRKMEFVVELELERKFDLESWVEEVAKTSLVSMLVLRMMEPVGRTKSPEERR